MSGASRGAGGTSAWLWSCRHLSYAMNKRVTAAIPNEDPLTASPAPGAYQILAFGQLPNCRLIQHPLRCLRGGEPRVTDAAGRYPARTAIVGIRRVDEVLRNNRPFERRHNVAESELMWIARQLVAAVGPALAANDSSATETGQKLIQIRFGDPLLGGDIGALHRTLAIPTRQLDNGMRPVVTSHCQSHGGVGGATPCPSKVWPNQPASAENMSKLLNILHIHNRLAAVSYTRGPRDQMAALLWASHLAQFGARIKRMRWTRMAA